MLTDLDRDMDEAQASMNAAMRQMSKLLKTKGRWLTLRVLPCPCHHRELTPYLHHIRPVHHLDRGHPHRHLGGVVHPRYFLSPAAQDCAAAWRFGLNACMCVRVCVRVCGGEKELHVRHDIKQFCSWHHKHWTR